MATILSQQFAAFGLQFFKVNKTVTHVCVARPHFLDMEATPVSEGVKRIVEFVNARPKSTRRDLVEALAPSPAALDGASRQTPELHGAPPTTEQTAVIADLHWLIHQGHVIEFANGCLETAKKPIPKPPKPQAKPQEAAPRTEPIQAGESAGPEPGIVTAPPSNAEAAPETAGLQEAEIPPVPPLPTHESLASEASPQAPETPVETQAVPGPPQS
jgi:hypothetical protein